MKSDDTRDNCRVLMNDDLKSIDLETKWPDLRSELPDFKSYRLRPDWIDFGLKAIWT